MSERAKVPETDWRLLSSTKDALRRRALEKGLGEILSILLRHGSDPASTLEEIFGQMTAIKTRDHQLFGGLTRHNCRVQLAAMLRLRLLGPEEVGRFTRATRLWAEKLLAAEQKKSPEPAVAPPSPPEVKARASDLGDFNGFILPDGECVRFDDLEAMERALRRRFGGDLKGILRGLRGFSLQLARDRKDDVARRLLGRARELGAGAPGEGLEMLRLGLAFEKIERYDFAGECYEHGRSPGRCDLEPWYFLHNNHAYCLAMLERFVEAEALARQAIGIEPRRHNAHKNLGLALMGQGRLEEAAESFRAARDLCPTDGRAAGYLAAIERRSGERQERGLN